MAQGNSKSSKRKKRSALVDQSQSRAFTSQREAALKWQIIFQDLHDKLLMGRPFECDGEEPIQRVRGVGVVGARLGHCERIVPYTVFTAEPGAEKDLLMLNFWMNRLLGNPGKISGAAFEGESESDFGKKALLVLADKAKSKSDFEEIPIKAHEIEIQMKQFKRPDGQRFFGFESPARNFQVDIASAFPNDLTDLLKRVAQARHQKDRSELSPQVVEFGRFFFERTEKISISMEVDLYDGEYSRQEIPLTMSIQKAFQAFREALRVLTYTEHKIEIFRGSPDLQIMVDGVIVKSDRLKRGLLTLGLIIKEGELLRIAPIEFVTAGNYSNTNPTTQIDQFLKLLSEKCDFVKVGKSAGRRDIAGIKFDIRVGVPDLKAQIQTLAESREPFKPRDSDIPCSKWSEPMQSSRRNATR